MDTTSTSFTDGKKVIYAELGPLGTGTIQAGDAQRDRLQEFTDRVGAGEFHRPTAETIPCTCIDGRCGATEGLAPNTAGGTETLMVADDLTTKAFAKNGSATCDQYAALLDYLTMNGVAVGGHTAADLHGAPSGCGANDKLSAIYAYMAANGETLKQLANQLLGYEIVDQDTDHERIIANAQARSDFSNGDELLNTLQSKGGRIDLLKGEHTEVLAVINRRAGTTLDRDAVEAEFGDNYEAFNVDEWAFTNGAQIIGDDEDIRQKRIAMLYYNLATAGVLCGPGMRVVVLD